MPGFEPRRPLPSTAVRVAATAFAGASLLVGSVVAQDSASAVVLVDDFSEGIARWQLQRLDRRGTVYTVVETEGDAALKGASNEGASALLLPLPSGSTTPGRLRWRWRVMASLAQNAREREKAGDDYAARVFVLFGDAELSEATRALAFVWAGREPVGSSYPNPYFPNVATVVLQSGDARAGQWVSEERDLAADYERAFGGPPPPPMAIAIMVDTDDTGAAAMAWFDRIEMAPPLP